MDPCASHGVYNPVLRECRCTAGWVGRFCSERRLRRCNVISALGREPNQLCAGNCDEERGLCYCAGLAHPFQRPLPDRCTPSAHTAIRLPDGRPAFPVELPNGSWTHFIGGGSGRRAAAFRRGGGWYREWAKPWRLVYDHQPADPAPSQIAREKWGSALSNPRLRGYCTSSSNASAIASTFDAIRRRGRPNLKRKHTLSSADIESGEVLLQCDSSCPEGRKGPFCEVHKRAFCLRDCSGNGRCDAGFCWCEAGWFGVDCSQRLQESETALKPPGDEGRDEQLVPQIAPRRQDLHALPSYFKGKLDLRIYVYDLPSEFTTTLLQYRGEFNAVYREINKFDASQYVGGSLYAAESALHEWLLDSPLRTVDPHEAHLFYVPVYVSSLFLWPIYGQAAEPQFGGPRYRGASRVQAATLYLEAVQAYLRGGLPFWNVSGGRDHVWAVLHDEGPCYVPRTIRNSILLTHYGYHTTRPCAWTTYKDDDWLADTSFYEEHIGSLASFKADGTGRTDDASDVNAGRGRLRSRTPCFNRQKDLVIPPWKSPDWWHAGFASREALQPHRPRRLFVFFAGELGGKRLPGYSHDLRQVADALFCDPKLALHRSKGCLKYADGCRDDLQPTCSKWRPGVLITAHVGNGPGAYQAHLLNSTYCLAFPGDGWSSRVLDAVVHGCVPVVVQDESLMFNEGAFELVGAPELDFDQFSVRIVEAQLPELLQILDAVPLHQLRKMQEATLRVRDYFVYKDIFSPYRYMRNGLLSKGLEGQDALLLLALSLEARARDVGKLGRMTTDVRARNRRLLRVA